MNLLLHTEKKPWGVTSERIHMRIMQEVLPAYNSPGPFGMPPLEPDMPTVFREVTIICAEEESRSRKGFTISSSFSVSHVPELRAVIVTHLLNENEDEVFLTLMKKKQE
jgi:hypothetical protein